ncbi:hypothetical protein [Brachybacterium sacelli]
MTFGSPRVARQKVRRHGGNYGYAQTLTAPICYGASPKPPD